MRHKIVKQGMQQEKVIEELTVNRTAEYQNFPEPGTVAESKICSLDWHSGPMQPESVVHGIEILSYGSLGDNATRRPM